MALDFNQSGGNKQDLGRIDDGTYPARVAQIIDLGRQQETAWVGGKAVPQYYVVGKDGKAEKNSEGFAKKSGKESSMPCIQPKVFITYEFPTETIEIDGEAKPRWQSKEYNVTNAGALYKLVQALKPDATRVSEIAGLPCTVSIGSTESGNAKVASVGAVMKGMTVDKLSKDPVVFDLSNPDVDVFKNLPSFLQEKIKASEDFDKSELKALLAAEEARGGEPKGGDDDFDDDPTPF